MQLYFFECNNLLMFLTVLHGGLIQGFSKVHLNGIWFEYCYLNLMPSSSTFTTFIVHDLPNKKPSWWSVYNWLADICSMILDLTGDFNSLHILCWLGQLVCNIWVHYGFLFYILLWCEYLSIFMVVLVHLWISGKCISVEILFVMLFVWKPVGRKPSGPFALLAFRPFRAF